MTLRLYFHPLASFCWKALIAFYENGAPFVPEFVDLMDAEKRAAYEKISPQGKMPALIDDARGERIFESAILIEYLDAFYPGATRLIPADADIAWRARMWNSYFDSYLHIPMQKIVADTFRAEGGKDPAGVAEAHDTIRKAYAALDKELAGRTWAAGDTFTLGDCAAVPALIYADCVEPLGDGHPVVAAYMDRLRARPSVRRTLEEAKPFFPMFPFPRKPQV
jgi:glutathione S-transferase